MLFNSFTFLIFFVIVLLVSRKITSWRFRKGFLLFVSYIFYAAWNPPFVILLWISTVIDWDLAKKIDQEPDQKKCRMFLVWSLVLNLGMLGYFKYAGFMIDNFVFLVNHLGIPYAPLKPSIVLPVGISFYTFQTLSYTFDVYKRKMKPWHSFLDYALYVTFFPQLVAGPIVRAEDFLPQCDESKKGNAQQIGWGLSLMIIGLFNKVFIADSLMSPIAEKVYSSAAAPAFFESWAGTTAFAVQIFCDFAGYSTCAIGAAMCFGFALSDNFRFPYGAIGFSDFWSRWHISLSSWLKEYLYISLGGNRKGNLRTLVNLMMTMLLGGLWHGASWLFVIWGGLHGILLVFERWIKTVWISKASFWRTHLGELCLAGATFSCICMTWVFFRAKSLTGALQMLKGLYGLNGLQGFSNPGLSLKEYLLSAGFGSAIFLAHYFLRNKTLEDAFGKIPMWLRSTALAVMGFIIMTSLSGEDRAFIYFQF